MMEKKLPNLFQNKVEKKINNNENIYYSQNRKIVEEDINPIDIRKKINDIFSSPNYICSALVDITMNQQIKTTKIIGRNKDYLITIDNEKIYISDIKDIKSKSF